jgi:hypothetical protein
VRVLLDQCLVGSGKLGLNNLVCCVMLGRVFV